jgi:putative addiction module CopG family antidote
MTIDLSPKAKALIEHLIETRGYRDPEAVIEEALRVLAEGEPSIEDDEEYLRRLIQEGRDSGPAIAVDPENLKDHLINGVPLRPLR